MVMSVKKDIKNDNYNLDYCGFPVEEEIIPERHIDKKTEIEIKGKKLSEKDANKELALRMLDSFGNV